jgi:hypothetical protein
MRLPLAIVAMASLLGSWALAHSPTCNAEARAKKLADPELSSFLWKCKRDAHVHCDKSAADKKVPPADKNAHVKKCVTDRVGS